MDQLNSNQISSNINSLEQRQIAVLKQLDQLQVAVAKFKQQYQITDNTHTCTVSSTFCTAKSDELAGSKLDIVINVDPSSVPLSLVILCEELQNHYSVQMKTFVHSSVSDTVPDDLRHVIISSYDRRHWGEVCIVVNWIWKKISCGPQLIVDLTNQTAIMSEVNIARYLMRLIDSGFDTDDIVKATKIDEFLDLIELYVRVGNVKGRAAVIEKVNKVLEKQDWLVGADCCVADVVLWSVLHQTGHISASLPNNVTKWLSQCESHTLFQSAAQNSLRAYTTQNTGRTSQSAGRDDSTSYQSRPNFFVAVEVLDPQISAVAKSIQDGIQEASSRNYDGAFITPEKFHITLMVMALNNEEDIQRAAVCLEKCIPDISTLVSGQPVNLDFEGLSVFGGGRVLFSSVKESEGLTNLHKIADLISHQMEECGILSTDGDRDWHPHLTLMKFPRSKQFLKRKLKRVEPSDYAAYVNTRLGTQVVRSVQLCQMNKKREDGYYFVQFEGCFASEF